MLCRLIFASLFLSLCAAQLSAQPVQDFSEKAFFGNTTDHSRRATAAEDLRLAKNFQAELLYTVPENQGSWVCLTADSQGRLIASAQWGGLYRITPPPIRGDLNATKVEPIDAEIGNAQGLLYANDSLYVVMSSEESGLYRVRDIDHDDQFDDVELLRAFEGDGEHGPHAVVLGPDKKSLYVVGGNGSHLTKPWEKSLGPPIWREDRLLRRMGASDGEFERERPGAWICRTDLDGQHFELVAMGMRNPYDIAFNQHGELFTFDSDMEWDEGTPWYRPTRVNHVISGADFGWRAGTAKWHDDYIDSFGSVVDVGFSSPTGITFGTGAQFPGWYQNALFICDWSLGNIYAVHFYEHGASYEGELERVVTAAPLPVTDIVINPVDGALYFTTGGRGITSALYRITYIGNENLARLDVNKNGDDRKLRHCLEQFHSRKDPMAIDIAWEHLSSSDRAIRYAARLAIENQDIELWQQRALEETDPRKSIAALVALARHADERLLTQISARLSRLEWKDFAEEEDLRDLLRAHMIALSRNEALQPMTRRHILAALDKQFPSGNSRLDRELAEILAFLQAPHIIDRLLDALEQAKTQQEQIHFAMCLADVPEGWTTKSRSRYFAWFARAGTQGGGVSFKDYMGQLRALVIKNLTEEEKQTLLDLLSTPVEIDPYAELKSRPVVKQWNIADLRPGIEFGENGDALRGQQVFAAAACYRCHRFEGQGGVTGPDLSAIARRFTPRDLLEAIVDPSRVVSDQYRGVQIAMNDGRVVSGKIRDQSGNVLLIMTDPANPADLLIVKRDEIEEMKWSTTSLMPSGLLDTFTEQEIQDLFVFLRKEN